MMHELIKRAQNGDEEAMSQIIQENAGLVWNIVRRFSGRGYDREDLFQIGVLGFVKSIKRFRLDFDNKLSTYAVTMIIGEIKRFLRDDGMIKVSRNLKELSSKVREIKEYHLKQLGVELSLEEISKMLNIAKEDIVLALEATSFVDSLERPIGEEDDNDTLYQKIANQENDYEKLLDKMTVKRALSILTENEKKIIIYRYYREMTQQQIANIMCTSQVQISRIEKKALEKMKCVVQ